MSRQRGHDAGREQIRISRCRRLRDGRIQDEVMRRRHEQRHDGGRDCHADGEIAIESALDHLRIIVPPIAETSATAEPDTPPKNSDDSTLIWPKPAA